jgi:hypothetical protein
MKTMCVTLLAGIGLMLSGPVAAHHAVGGEYDPNKPVTVTGTVTKIDWVNPHARVYFDVTDASGTETNWSGELAARGVLERMGWSGRSLKPGQVVTVIGDQARSGAPMLNARARENRLAQDGKTPEEYPITLEDGTPVLNNR